MIVANSGKVVRYHEDMKGGTISFTMFTLFLSSPLISYSDTLSIDVFAHTERKRVIKTRTGMQCNAVKGDGSVQHPVISFREWVFMNTKLMIFA